MKTLWLVAAAAMLTATGALAQDATAEAAKEQKKVCKSEKVTGSLTRVRRVCMTQVEWDELAATSRKRMDDISRTAGMAGGQSNANGASSGM